MKSGAPLKRHKPLRSQGEGLTRSSGLHRKAVPARRKTFGSATPEHQAAVEARGKWSVEAHSRPCRVCGAVRGLTGHHVVSKQQLRKMGQERLKWDQRNLMTLCLPCHEGHENASRRVAYELLSRDNLAFVAELDLGWYLERRYPRQPHMVFEDAA